MEMDPSALFPSDLPPFHALSSDDLAALKKTAQVVVPDENGIAFRANSTRSGLALLVRGSLLDAAAIVYPSGAIARHGIVAGAIWEEDVKASKDAVFLVLDDRALRQVYRHAPAAFQEAPAFRSACALQNRISEMLRTKSLFHNASEALLEDLETVVPVQHYLGGDHLSFQGSQADELFIIISGMIRPSLTHADGTKQAFDFIGPGATVGELGVILGQARAADILAVRDCEVLVMNTAIYEKLLDRHPIDMNRAFCRSIYTHFNAPKGASARAGAVRPRTVAVVALEEHPVAADIAHALNDALSFAGVVRILVQADHDSFEAHGNNLTTSKLCAIESSVDLLVYVGDKGPGPWMDLCLRQADHILFVCSAKADPSRRPLEKRVAEDPAMGMKEHSLLVLHPPDAPRPHGAREWRRHRPGTNVHHIRQDNRDDIGRIARTLMKNAIGLVLGGGGARGFAHVGVIRALKSQGITVDMVGGNSMGALVGAQFARGDSPEEILERTRDFACKIQFPTLPIISLIWGQRLVNGLEEIFGDLTYDDLWTPFFTVACDLTEAKTSVLDSGSVLEGVLASNSPAGILPPFTRGGHLYVDGAILNNVPVDVMRERIGPGRVIAIDVNQREELLVEPELSRLSVRDALSRLILRRGPKLPTLPEILVRAGIVGGISHRDRTKGQADLYFEPPVSDFSLIDYKRAEQIARIGEEAAMVRLREWGGWRQK